MIERDSRELWRRRARFFNKLQWVSNRDIIDELIKIADLSLGHVVLDAGTGSGKVDTAICHLVKEVHSTDICKEMLDLVENRHYPNLVLRLGDIRAMDYPCDSFDRVVARLVYHHILTKEERSSATRECYRVLKKGGEMIICEGVPPQKELLDDYTEIFKLKEDRVVYLPEDIVRLMEDTGFTNVVVYSFVDQDFSVRNWLDNDGTLTPETKDKIFDLHRYARQTFKEAYNLRELGFDILIDTKMVFVVGEK